MIWLLCLILTACNCSNEDLVTMQLEVQYKHPWYSGYLNFTMGKFHYVYFPSQKSPNDQPLVLWLNGGPGCSSLIGMVYENGPFLFEPNTSKLHLNPYSWNNKANLLYVESPGGVGFSKGSRKIYDDGNTAEDNLAALLAFFNKFPNLRDNEFYLTGESYSGIYVPYLAYEIVKYNKLPSSKGTRINLKGMMVGNACTEPKECYDATAQGNSLYQYEFLYNHGYYSAKDYHDMFTICVLDFHGQECQDQRDNLDNLFAQTNTSILNIYAPCYYTVGKGRTIRQSNKIVGGDMDCGDSVGIHEFFNQPLIPPELHVDAHVFQQCSDYVADTYVSYANSSYWIYPILMEEGLRVWVYSGDVDADVPITGTVSWLYRLKEELGLPTLTPWREWWVKGLHQHEDQVGGMVWGMKNITFVSVKGAGHMVPHDKPQAAEVLIRAFVEGREMPEKDS